MISKEIKDRLDPEVYEFYKAAFEGPGFAQPFTVADIPLIREDEVVRHANNLEPYVTNCFDLEIDREGAEPLPVRVYIPNRDDSDVPAESGDGEAGAGAAGGGDGKRSKPASARSIFSVGAPGSDLPVLLYFHGGGFVMGSIYDHDPLCGKLADACNAIVIAVEYRLAPEYPFPACIDDARDAANWAYEHAADFGGDPERMMAGGDSSGANMAAVLALMAKEKDESGAPLAPELSYLILFYGVFGCHTLEDSESAAKYGNGDFVLPKDMMDTFMELYLPEDRFPEGQDTHDYRLAPGRDGDLSDFPPSVIVTAEFDPLRDDGETFAKLLEEKGRDVELIRLDGMMHGFILYWQKFSKAERLINEIGDRVRRRFSK